MYALIQYVPQAPLTQCSKILWNVSRSCVHEDDDVLSGANNHQRYIVQAQKQHEASMQYKMYNNAIVL